MHPPTVSDIIAREKHLNLTDRLQRRDPEALRDLYDLYGRTIFSLIVRIVRHSTDAEELVQDTFLRAWTRADLLDSHKAVVGPWLKAIARNRALDHLRHTGSRRRRFAPLDQLEDPGILSELERDVDISLGAERLASAMGKLNQQQRAVIRLAYFEGLSQTEIAATLACPLGTVKTWARSALRMLRDELGPRPPAVNPSSFGQLTPPEQSFEAGKPLIPRLHMSWPLT